MQSNVGSFFWLSTALLKRNALTLLHVPEKSATASAVQLSMSRMIAVLIKRTTELKQMITQNTDCKQCTTIPPVLPTSPAPPNRQALVLWDVRVAGLGSGALSFSFGWFLCEPCGAQAVRLRSQEPVSPIPNVAQRTCGHCHCVMVPQVPTRLT